MLPSELIKFQETSTQENYCIEFCFTDKKLDLTDYECINLKLFMFLSFCSQKGDKATKIQEIGGIRETFTLGNMPINNRIQDDKKWRLMFI